MDLFLMSSPDQASPGMGIMDLAILFLPLILIMYFIVIRPQRREQKEREGMLSSIKKGDVVVTHGGIIGKVVKIKDDRIELKVDESTNTKINFLRTAIYRVMSKETEKEETKDK